MSSLATVRKTPPGRADEIADRYQGDAPSGLCAGRRRGALSSSELMFVVAAAISDVSASYRQPAVVTAVVAMISVTSIAGGRAKPSRTLPEKP